MKVDLELRGVDAEFSRLVEFAEEFADRCNLPASDRARLLIILEEIFTNVTRYGYPADSEKDGRVEVALRFKPGRIEIYFSDDGQPFNPLVQGFTSLDDHSGERPIGGFGLHILRAFAGEGHYRREAGRNHLMIVYNVGTAAS